MAKSTRKLAPSKATWKPPDNDFPLSHHPPSRRLYQKIKGTRYYFGYDRDWKAALANDQANRDRIQAGKKLRPITSGDALTVTEFMAACGPLLSATAREISNRRSCQSGDCLRFCEGFGYQLTRDRS
jgi:hypothetical protein